jgi:hypothetical protein
MPESKTKTPSLFIGDIVTWQSRQNAKHTREICKGKIVSFVKTHHGKAALIGVKRGSTYNRSTDRMTAKITLRRLTKVV